MRRALGCCPNLRHLKITDYLTLKSLEVFGLDSWWPEKTNGKVVQLDLRLAPRAGKLMEIVELVRKLQAHANIVALEILGPVIDNFQTQHHHSDELSLISELVSQTLRMLSVRDFSSQSSHRLLILSSYMFIMCPDLQRFEGETLAIKLCTDVQKK